MGEGEREREKERENKKRKSGNIIVLFNNGLRGERGYQILSIIQRINNIFS